MRVSHQCLTGVHAQEKLLADLPVGGRSEQDNKQPTKAGRLEECVSRDLECFLDSTSTGPCSSLEEMDAQCKGVK